MPQSNFQHQNSFNSSGVMQGGERNTQHIHNHYGQQIQEDLGIIEDVFDYVLKNKKEKKFKKGKFIDIIEKIEINFKGYEDEVNEYLRNAYEYRVLVEEVFTKLDSDDQEDMHGDIYDRYIRLKRDKADNFDILLDLFKQYIPKHKISNPKYRRIARAIVIFFFEDCTWGKKTEREKEVYK